jgi:hypothetical protein
MPWFRDVLTAIGIGFEWHSGYPGVYGWLQSPPMWDGTARFAVGRSLGPLSEGRMVFYGKSAHDIGQPDPCNKVVGREKDDLCPPDMF